MGNAYSEDVEECDEKLQHGVYNLVVQVVNDSDKARAAGSISKFDINLDSYCTRHMNPYFLLEQPKPCVVDIVVGNKEKLQSTHKGNMRLGNLVFTDVVFAPGLLQMLITEPQLELKGKL